MKFIANSFLILIFVPLFLLTVVAGSLKYQLLNYSFWQANLSANNTYTKLNESLTKISQLKTGRGVKDDGIMKVFLKIATPDNLKDFVENNIKNFLTFANGENKDWIVYIPVSKLPKSLSTINGVKLVENTSILQLSKDFKIQGLQEKQINNLARTGKNVTAFVVYGSLLLIIVILISFLLVQSGDHFIAPGLTFILSGLLLYGVVTFLKTIQRSMVSDWPKSTEPAQLLLAPIAPNILNGILKPWSYIALTAIALGIIFILLKKPQFKV